MNNLEKKNRSSTQQTKESDGILTCTTSDDLNIALYQAVVSQDVLAVERRLQENGDPNWRNPYKKQFLNTTLHNAAYRGNAEICSTLLRGGADTEIENELGNKPLMFAACYGHVECARVLLAHGADISAYSSKNGLTALHKACMEGRVQIVQVLLAHGAFLKAIDKKGRTPEQLIGIEGKRTPSEKEIREISEILRGGGGKRIFSALHKRHEFAFTVAFTAELTCSHCEAQVQIGRPFYLCQQCGFKLCLSEQTVNSAPEADKWCSLLSCVCP